jgi:hypothetical protein
MDTNLDSLHLNTLRCLIHGYVFIPQGQDVTAADASPHMPRIQKSMTTSHPETAATVSTGQDRIVASAHINAFRDKAQ